VALRRVADVSLFRREIENDPVFREAFREMLLRVTVAGAANAARDELLGLCPAPCDGVLTDVFGPVALRSSTRLALHADDGYTTKRGHEGRVERIVTRDTEFVLDEQEQASFARMETCDAFSARDLADGEHVDACIELLERLFREGIVRLLESPATCESPYASECFQSGELPACDIDDGRGRV
jgi:hypothetical protein